MRALIGLLIVLTASSTVESAPTETQEGSHRDGEGSHRDGEGSHRNGKFVSTFFDLLDSFLPSFNPEERRAEYLVWTTEAPSKLDSDEFFQRSSQELANFPHNQRTNLLEENLSGNVVFGSKKRRQRPSEIKDEVQVYEKEDRKAAIFEHFPAFRSDSVAPTRITKRKEEGKKNEEEKKKSYEAKTKSKLRFKFPPKEKEIEKETAKESFEEELESQESVINEDYYTELKDLIDQKAVETQKYETTQQTNLVKDAFQQLNFWRDQLNSNKIQGFVNGQEEEKEEEQKEQFDTAADVKKEKFVSNKNYENGEENYDENMDWEGSPSENWTPLKLTRGGFKTPNIYTISKNEKIPRPPQIARKKPNMTKRRRVYKRKPTDAMLKEINREMGAVQSVNQEPTTTSAPADETTTMYHSKMKFIGEMKPTEMYHSKMKFMGEIEPKPTEKVGQAGSSGEEQEGGGQEARISFDEDFEIFKDNFNKELKKETDETGTPKPEMTGMKSLMTEMRPPPTKMRPTQVEMNPVDMRPPTEEAMRPPAEEAMRPPVVDTRTPTIIDIRPLATTTRRPLLMTPMKDLVVFEPVINLGTRPPPPPPLDMRTPIDVSRLPTMSISQEELDNINLDNLPTLDGDFNGQLGSTDNGNELMKTQSSSSSVDLPTNPKARNPIRMRIPQEASQLEMVPVGDSGFSMLPFDDFTTPVSFAEVMKERVPVVNMESLDDLITDDPIQAKDIPDFMKTINFMENDPDIQDLFGQLEPQREEVAVEDEEQLVDVPEDISLTQDEMDLLNKMIVSDSLSEAEMDQVKQILEVKMTAMQNILEHEQDLQEPLLESKSVPENPPVIANESPEVGRMPVRPAARFPPVRPSISARFPAERLPTLPNPTNRFAPNRMISTGLKKQEETLMVNSDFNLPASKGGDVASFPIVLQLPKDDCPKYCINIKVEVTRLGRSLAATCRNTPLCNNNNSYNRRYRR